MNPQCQDCGKIVSLRQGITTEFDVKQEFFGEGRPKHIYLCVSCSTKDNIERFKRVPWYAGHRTI